MCERRKEEFQRLWNPDFQYAFQEDHGQAQLPTSATRKTEQHRLGIVHNLRRVVIRKEAGSWWAKLRPTNRGLWPIGNGGVDRAGNFSANPELNRV